MAAPYETMDTLEERRAALADHLRAAAAEWHDRAPGISQVLTTLARQCDHDPVAIWSPRLDEIMTMAEQPLPYLEDYSTMDLDAATVRMQAKRDAEPDFHTMLRWSQVYWRLHNEVCRRTGSGIVAPMTATTGGQRRGGCRGAGKRQTAKSLMEERRMTQDDKNEVLAALRDCQQAIIALAKPLIVYRLMLEDMSVADAGGCWRAD